MIRQSVVLKLWLTIIVLVLMVLAILSLYLEQFLNSYVMTMQRRDLTSQAMVISELLKREPNQTLAYEIGSRIMTALHGQYDLVPPPQKSARSRAFLTALTPTERNDFLTGHPYVDSGVPALLPHASPNTVVYAVMPIHNQQHGLEAFLVITEMMDPKDDPAKVISDLIMFAVILGTVLTTGLAFVVSKNLSRPLIEMIDAAEEMARGKFDTRVRVVTQDEVGRLGYTFNHVAGELERTVRALTEEKEEIGGILGAMTDAVVAADVDGRLTLLNPSAEQWLRNLRSLSAEERPFALPEELIQMQRDTLESRSRMTREFFWHGRHFIGSMTPLYQSDRKSVLRGTVTVLRDVTEERRLDRLRKDFIANVSHELRTPLALFQGYAEALLDDFGDDPDQRTEITQIIYDESLRMRRLVNELLDLAQLESGNFSMRFERMDMLVVLRRVARKYFNIYAERGLSLKLETELNSIIVCADVDRIEQVLTNLVDNALRHTREGGVSLQVTRNESHLILRVRDTGEGIPQEDVPFVFERFYKADKARTRSRGGTGLGLAITQNLIRAHGGEIGVESQVGIGTTFSVVIPISFSLCQKETD
ncbi:sensor histidine kinase [Ferroacidibacillus organovorans]|uniref:histidine kinase n=1 Tax=Ferroacidibacillus organovorans TaxID=1765683 RepID=A0A162T4D1_9BACL|nr:ATP-binding protein [Ferroacidibacillus organovorans]KYP80453.1 hypothetical protein AYJ22_02055 [Ferroacidibacillus organovorans]OAG94681.1 hypothetical protein AYW79_03820 [Ferroacidibacillus organovorans]OPG16601.1 sensor histidine kinase [Ferroacidibacillus organovorans]